MKLVHEAREWRMAPTAPPARALSLSLSLLPSLSQTLGAQHIFVLSQLGQNPATQRPRPPPRGAGLGPWVLPGVTAVVPRPPPVASFSLCALRLFVIKRTYSLR